MEKLDRFSIISTGRKTIESPMTRAYVSETYKQVTLSPGERNVMGFGVSGKLSQNKRERERERDRNKIKFEDTAGCS